VYFELVERKIKEYNILPKNIYNIDKKDILISFLIKVKRVVLKAALDSKRLLGDRYYSNRE
ncbi:uncharacterized protein MYCFIDRAFT_140854, partial [Pseudocercospora fijiensis CIRAD86]